MNMNYTDYPKKHDNNVDLEQTLTLSSHRSDVCQNQSEWNYYEILFLFCQ